MSIDQLRLNEMQSASLLARPVNGVDLAGGHHDDAFVATLAHELRQPLNAISNAVELLARDAGGDRTMPLDIMRRQIQEMRRLIDDVSAAPPSARRGVPLLLQRLDLRHAVDAAGRAAVLAASLRGQELVVTLSAEALWVDADPNRLHQVLSNLLDNAVKFTGRGGRIWLSAAREADNVVVRVRDTGRGFDSSAPQHIFDLFFQVRPAEHLGTGIGLSVVRDIMTRHRGCIDALSQGRGKGSEFVIMLPFARPI
jgi:signal transduction histidine kinase